MWLQNTWLVGYFSLIIQHISRYQYIWDSTYVYISQALVLILSPTVFGELSAKLVLYTLNQSIVDSIKIRDKCPYSLPNAVLSDRQY